MSVSLVLSVVIFSHLTQTSYQLNFTVVLFVFSFFTSAIGGRFGPNKTSLTPPQQVCACPKSGSLISLCVSCQFTF